MTSHLYVYIWVLVEGRWGGEVQRMTLIALLDRQAGYTDTHVESHVTEWRAHTEAGSR